MKYVSMFSYDIAPGTVSTVPRHYLGPAVDSAQQEKQSQCRSGATGYSTGALPQEGTNPIMMPIRMHRVS